MNRTVMLFSLDFSVLCFRAPHRNQWTLKKNYSRLGTQRRATRCDALAMFTCATSSLLFTYFSLSVVCVTPKKVPRMETENKTKLWKGCRIKYSLAVQVWAILILWKVKRRRLPLDCLRQRGDLWIFHCADERRMKRKLPACDENC